MKLTIETQHGTVIIERPGDGLTTDEVVDELFRPALLAMQYDPECVSEALPDYNYIHDLVESVRKDVQPEDTGIRQLTSKEHEALLGAVDYTDADWDDFEIATHIVNACEIYVKGMSQEELKANHGIY